LIDGVPFVQNRRTGEKKDQDRFVFGRQPDDKLAKAGKMKASAAAYKPQQLPDQDTCGTSAIQEQTRALQRKKAGAVAAQPIR
jgi:hypothetical protein